MTNVKEGLEFDVSLTSLGHAVYTVAWIQDLAKYIKNGQIKIEFVDPDPRIREYFEYVTGEGLEEFNRSVIQYAPDGPDAHTVDAGELGELLLELQWDECYFDVEDQSLTFTVQE